VAGVTVQLLDGDGNVVATRVTDSNGNYLFTGLEPGSYSVRFDHSTATTAGIAGYAPGGAGTDPLVDSDVATTSGTTGTTAAFTLAPGDAKRDVDAGVVLQTASIGDRVWLDRDRDGIQDDGEPGVAGVTVQLLDGDGNVVATRVTDSNGNYLFDDIEPGTYTVRFDHSTSSITGIRGWSPTGAGTADTDSDASPTGVTGPITVAAGDAIRNVDAGITLLLGSVSGRIYEDVDEGYGYDDGEAPFAGLTIQLIDKDGNVVAETTTGADGTYRFDDVEPGDYTIKIVDPPAGRVFETPGPVTVVAGEESVNHNSGFHVVIPVVTVPPTTSTVPSTTSTVPATTPTTSTPGQVSGNGSTSRPANSTPSSVATRALARTGAETRSLAVIGGLMTVIGGAVVIVTRRRAL
jgi:protocatechuate 3,4-dioxygenase beta subunit